MPDQYSGHNLTLGCRSEDGYSTVVLTVFVMYFEILLVLPKPHMKLWHIKSIVAFCQYIGRSSILQACEIDACQWGRLASYLLCAYAGSESPSPGFSLSASLSWSFHRGIHSGPPTDWFHMATFLRPGLKSILHEVYCHPDAASPDSTRY